MEMENLVLDVCIQLRVIMILMLLDQTNHAYTIVDVVDVVEITCLVVPVLQITMVQTHHIHVKLITGLVVALIS